jgi:TonB family protein
MLTGNNVGSFLVLLLLVLAIPDGIEARQTTEPKADSPRADTNRVTSPQCVYCPAPSHSRKARKAKISDTVLLDVTVTADGQVAKPIVLNGPSDSLNEQAMEAVRKWKMKPPSGPDGKPIDCRVQSRSLFTHIPPIKKFNSIRLH